MPDFATVADVAEFLQVEIATAGQIAAASAALRSATAAIRNYCRQMLTEVVGDVITLDGKGRPQLLLPQLPVIAVASVAENDVTLTAVTDYMLGQHGILYRAAGGWACGIQNITVTYSHGYDTLPDDIIAVCIRAAARAYQAGLKSADSEGVLGVASKSLGDFSVAYQSESGGGMGEGVLGASAARLLLMSEKDILDRYRV